ncbi:erythroblast NAD(P)(+)--arginine ADP-ribosyltransferase-like [Acipenser ruthenus]|uniref:erythroblast NAD(P)(+)--arginine ADP-ribosyltransferase-like n=1 Tax=Acipenser ruthenus TaxID=7906 RepID=UPI00274111B0|nr:erythroblast NAD(P)(+)--arginine ADP-ribosyltransferase-like [Acipenser ruthenus]
MKNLVPSILILSAVILLEFPQTQCFKASKPMDLAGNSLDDQYVGCRKEMLKIVNKKYLSSEFKKNPDFKNAWDTAKKTMKKKKQKALKLEQAMAIYVYTMDAVHDQFNKAVREGGTHYKDFPFKSLHFLLTDALNTLRSQKGKCYKVFRGVTKKSTAVVGAIVRFGQFASTSVDKNVAKEFGTTTVFEIHTCLGVLIEEYSDNPYEEEVLIPPFEKFKVLNVKGNQIQLEHIPDKTSNFNCLGVKKNMLLS